MSRRSPAHILFVSLELAMLLEKIPNLATLFIIARGKSSHRIDIQNLKYIAKGLLKKIVWWHLAQSAPYYRPSLLESEFSTTESNDQDKFPDSRNVKIFYAILVVVKKVLGDFAWHNPNRCIVQYIELLLRSFYLN